MLSIEEVEASLRQLTANLPSAAPSLGGATVQSAAQSGWVTNTQFLGSISLTPNHILLFAPVKFFEFILMLNILSFEAISMLKSIK